MEMKSMLGGLGGGGLAPQQLEQVSQNRAAEQAQQQLASDAPDAELRETFQQFVGQTLFGSMLSSMRDSVGTPAYMHGGKTEEVFQSQLDQYIVDDMSKASAGTIADPMFDLFTMHRSS